MTAVDGQRPTSKRRKRQVGIRPRGASVKPTKTATPSGQPSAWDVFSKWSAARPWRKRLFGLTVTMLILGTVSLTVPSIGGAIDYVALKVRVPGAFERGLSEELKSGVRVVERDTTLDLSGWKQTNSRDIHQESKVSRGLSLTSFTLQKTHPGAKYFVHTVTSESRVAPSIWCDSHPFQVVEANAQGSSGLHQWNVLVDISQEPDDATFTANLVVTFWNGFQKPSDLWSGFRVLYSTEKAVYHVIFPPALPAADVRFRYMDMTANQTVDLDAAKLEVTSEPGKTPTQKINWTVDNPQPDRSYQVTWTWPESAATVH
jgi:hypothetical protein